VFRPQLRCYAVIHSVRLTLFHVDIDYRTLQYPFISIQVVLGGDTMIKGESVSGFPLLSQ